MGLRKALVRMLALFRIFVFPTPQAAVYNLTSQNIADSFPEPDRLQAIEFLHAVGMSLSLGNHKNKVRRFLQSFVLKQSDLNRNTLSQNNMMTKNKYK